MLVGAVTYIVYPALLVLRDYFLWKIINTFILNGKLREKIRSYAIQANIWNHKFAVKTTINRSEGETSYVIDGNEVSSTDWKMHHDTQDKIAQSIDEHRLYINRKSNFLTWILKHYKQEATNPINDWVKNEKARIEERGTESVS